MRYSFVAAAIIGAVAAAPEYGYPVNSQPSYDNSYPVESSSAGYVASTPAASSTKPSYDNGYPVPSSTPAYEVPSSSSAPAYSQETPSSSKPVAHSSSVPSYGHESSSSAGYPIYTPSSSAPVYSQETPSSSKPVVHSSSVPSYGHGSSSAGYPIYTPSSSVPYPTASSSSKGHGYSSFIPTGHSSSVPNYPTSTKELTTYTTTTVCPVTQTHGTQVVTTLTTSTVTITSCKNGCHGYETTAVPPKPTSSKPEDKTTVVTTYDWVPCSTEVGHSGSSKIYSTYLTASYKTYTSTIYGQPPKPTGEVPHASKDNVPSYSVGVPQYTPVPSQPAGPKTTAVVGVPPHPSQPAADTCPPPVTVTKTVTVGVDVPSYTPVVPGQPEQHTTKVITVTESGKPHTYTVTVPTTPAGPKPTPSSKTSSELYPTSKPSQGSSIHYSSSAPAPYPTNSVPVKPSSSSVKPSASSTPGYPVAPSSSSVKPSASSTPGYEPYPIPSSSKATPVPTGGYGSGYGY